MNWAALDWGILGPALVAGLLVLATHVPLGTQVLDRGIVFIDLSIAQVAGLGVTIAGGVPTVWLPLLDYRITVNLEPLHSRPEIKREERAIERLEGEYAGRRRHSLLVRASRDAIQETVDSLPHRLCSSRKAI